jgi:hypothetical protein
MAWVGEAIAVATAGTTGRIAADADSNRVGYVPTTRHKEEL